ncbi:MULTISPECIES: hypothetical protein [Streptomyces]|uniref:hypothetical protein n=1 Tax=Streptomyces TaxID=1883 RepID=UPI00225AECCC|nr:MULTISPECIES: hypothetical protein [Streptomyces]MCX4431951.1 hypothetical protein [Streptomyces mirabilis]
MTKDQGRPKWLDVLERCGLRVLETAVPQEAPPVNTAIYSVTGFEVEPVAVIPASSPRAADELDEKWHHCASTSALYGDKGEFLILPPLSGGSEIGWVAVTDPVGEHLPSRIAAATGSPEFLAVSMDGHHLCAASAEEDDHWVVRHEFS